MAAQSLELPDAALAEYLEQHVEGFRGPLTSAKFQGGQSNPTYAIHAASARVAGALSAQA